MSLPGAPRIGQKNWSIGQGLDLKFIWDDIVRQFQGISGGGDVNGPSSAVDGHLALFDGTTGKLIKDGGAPSTGDVAGPASAVSGHLAVFSGTSGKIIADGGPSLPASPSDATEFLNGAATPAYAHVKDSDLSLSNITTNDVSITEHGFAPKAPNDATKFLDGTGAYSVPSGGGGGGSKATQPFRLTLSTGNPIYRPMPATPSSTDTSLETTTFASPHGWTTGTIITVSATVGGLTAGTRYFINALSATVVAYYTTLANAIADTSRVNLTANITSIVVPTGVSNTTIYFSPTIGYGNQIMLFDGVSTWSPLTSAEVSIALGTLTASLPYDVFAYNNSGTLTLELLAWTSATARATALVSQDGIWVKTGATTRRYVGTFRTDTTTSTIQETGGPITTVSPKLFVWNMNNRVSVSAYRFEPASSWTTSTTPFREANGSTANQIEVMCGLVWDDIRVDVSILSQGSNTVATISIGEDSTTTPVFGATMSLILAQTTINGFISARVAKSVPLGYHVYAWLESGGGSSVTFYSDDGSLRRQGLTASWMM